MCFQPQYFLNNVLNVLFREQSDTFGIIIQLYKLKGTKLSYEITLFYEPSFLFDVNTIQYTIKLQNLHLLTIIIYANVVKRVESSFI